MTATHPNTPGATGGHFQSHYIPNTTDEQAEMLAALGIDSIDHLFDDIPDQFRNPALDLPAPLSELEIQKELAGMAAKNRPLGSGPSFLGAGSYDHFIPAIIKPLITRGEFITAYTPYQAEASQGTLQVIYEFQTLVCNLYGMEVANAGMYDGATSLAEAALMACRVTKREKVALANSISPAYSAVIRTYCQSQDIAVEIVDPSSPALDGETACIVLQYPNYFGYIEDLQKLVDSAHAHPTAMGMFQTPGHYGADIVTGDGQPLGIPSSYGGPYVGLFATKQEYIRQMPSRLSGRTVDKNGKTGYVLTLQTREQHIRRERATSNICTNEALYALAAPGSHRLSSRHGQARAAPGGRVVLPQGPLRGHQDRRIARLFPSHRPTVLPRICRPMPNLSHRDQPEADGTEHLGRLGREREHLQRHVALRH